MMKKNAFRMISLLLVLTLLIVFGIEIFGAADGDFVYASNHYNGVSYSSSFIPPETDTFYMLGNEDNILSARMTETYYWPLTNEIKASWDKQNELADGQIEISQNGEVVQVVERTDYTIQYDAKAMLDTIELYVGDAALASRFAFETLQLEYRDALQDYNQAYIDYEEELAVFMEKVRSENLEVTEDDFPDAPAKAEDMTLFSTDLLKGFLIHLPVGTYSVQFRLADGSLQENSQKKLVIFEAIEDGVGYRVFSEKRWTIDETNSDESEIVYTTAGNRLFFQPYHQRLYNELYYLQMSNPQDKSARKDRNIWMPFSDLEDSMVQLSGDGDGLFVEEGDYYVQQTKGYTLGYEILDYDAETMDTISFSAHAVDADLSGDVIFLETMDANGNSFDGSDREVRVLRTERNWVVYLMSGLPVFFGIGLIYLRKQKVRNEKIVG